MRPDRVLPRSPDGRCVHVIIDTPGGSANRYKFDPDLGPFLGQPGAPIRPELSPYDFGSILEPALSMEIPRI